MKFGVVMFPGSNCDHDTYHVISKVIGQPVDFLWHRQNTVADCDAVILPGGFSYGDYLRTGAIARFSPVMGAIKEFASRGGLVMGICNGFQILCEAGLLPGALLRNKDLRFICDHVNIRVEATDTPYTNRCQRGQVLSVPIAHGDGNYFCDAETLAELQHDNRIIFRYSDENGNLTANANPNGSLDNIAGICNRERNVLGLMPHPERASEQLLGSSDGRIIFYSLADTLAELAKAS
jgi:phosphoribosylformylglycinamidine synthase I